MAKKAALESESEIIVVKPAHAEASGDGGVVVETHAEPVERGQDMELVREHDKTVRLVFEDWTERQRPVAATAQSPQAEPVTFSEARRPLDAVGSEVDMVLRPSSTFEGAPRSANLRPWQRTVYRSSRGSEVRRYESAYGTSTLSYTRNDENGFREERFHSRLVDPIIGETGGQKEAPQAEAQEEVVTEPAKPAKKRRAFWFLGGKHKPGEDSGTAYLPAVPEAKAKAPAPVVVEETHEAWDPGHAETEVAAPVAKAPKKSSSKAYYDYAGDNHVVIELEGVGPEYAKRLQAQGVYTTARLCYEDAADLAERIDVPEKTVRTWQAMAELVKVKGIGPQFAEAMARAGITGIQELKDRRSNSIAEQVQKYLDSLDSNVIGTGVTSKRVQAWKKAASRMRKVRLPIPSTAPPETELVRGHIEVLKNRQTKALPPPKGKKTRKA